MRSVYTVEFSDNEARVQDSDGEIVLIFFADDEEDVEIRLADEGYEFNGPWQRYADGVVYALLVEWGRYDESS